MGRQYCGASEPGAISRPTRPRGGTPEVSGSGEGTRTLVWDGLDEHGVPSAPGVYVAFLDVGTGGIARRVVLLR